VTEFPPFADLVSLVATLRKTGKHGGLQKILESAWRAESCLGDLKQSNDCCATLRLSLATRAEDVSPQQHIIDRALMTTAMLLYPPFGIPAALKAETASRPANARKSHSRWDPEHSFRPKCR